MQNCLPDVQPEHSSVITAPCQDQDEFEIEIKIKDANFHLLFVLSGLSLGPFRSLSLAHAWTSGPLAELLQTIRSTTSMPENQSPESILKVTSEDLLIQPTIRSF